MRGQHKRAKLPMTGADRAVRNLARKAGLVYVSETGPGFRRRRAGKGFAYFDKHNVPLRDAGHLRRIRMLAIPPAYRDVWICTTPHGHLQATGVDARGRKQYRYHPEWRRAQDQSKFERMTRFARALPGLRRKIRRDLRRPGLPREKVLAAVVSLLDSTHVRIGNTEYARTNKSYGLTTLRSRHLHVRRHQAPLLVFSGKNGTGHRIEIEDAEVAKIVRRCHELPGRLLFQYLDEHGHRHAVSSADVNGYLQNSTQGDFTAKDFRTWAATLHTAALLAQMPSSTGASQASLKRNLATVVAAVAAELRNTPAVCRKSYIDPALFSAWQSGMLHRQLGHSRLPVGPASERRVLKLLMHRGFRKGSLTSARRQVH